MLFKQIKYRGDNFSYIIADETSREAAIVDPSLNQDVLMKLIKDQKLKLNYIINTHGHGDHTAGNDDLKRASGAKIVAHKTSNVRKDVSVEDGDILKLGSSLFIDALIIIDPIFIGPLH